MNTHRQDRTKKIITWLVAEVILNFVGLDNLADYSEYVFEHHATVSKAVPTVLIQAPPSFIEPKEFWS